MQLFLHDRDKKYAAENIIRIFFPDITLTADKNRRGDFVYFREGKRRKFVCYNKGEVMHIAYTRAEDTERFLYDFFVTHTGVKPPWGLLCGVRPLWLYRKRRESGMDAQQTATDMVQSYDVDDDKLAILKSCYDTQQRMQIERREGFYSLYISIPYCRSRCRYCSFISMSGENETEKAVYLQYLHRELEEIAAQAIFQKLKLLTIYIGGGTPTAISEQQLYDLLQCVNDNFKPLQEFTVEAGRPDCTNVEKLRILKQAGVDRISVNPQTFDDNILQGIGRAHSAADTVRCYEQARAQGHDNINMDLIAGLPGDTAAGFERSLRATLDLAPDSITVHSFTKKSGSFLSKQLLPYGEIAQMAAVRDKLMTNYEPYYIYRQKKTAENLENVGYAKHGKECLYNVYMMDELHTVLSAGAGAVTKYVCDGRKIKRKFNPKYPQEYILLHD